MRNIRRLILTSIAAVAFVGMTAATSHADCSDCSGNRRSSYGQATGGALPSDSGNMENPASSGDRYLGEPGNYNEQGVPGRPAQQLGAGAGGTIEQTAPYGSSSYQGCNCSNIQSSQYSGQGTGGFTGSQNPCYQGSSVSGRQLGAGAGAQVGPVGAGVNAGAGGGQMGAGAGAQVGNEQIGAGVGAGAGGATGYSQGSSYYQSGQATGGYTGAVQCDNIGTPCYKSGPVWSSDGSVGAGTGGPAEYRDYSQNYPGTQQSSQFQSTQQSSQFQSGQAAGGYQGQSVTTPCCVQCNPGMTSGSSVGAGPGGPAAYQQAYRSSQYAGGQQQNFNQNPCFTSGTVGSGTGGYTGYQQNYQQTPQSYQQYQQTPQSYQQSGYQQNYQTGTSYQGQGAGGTQNCYSQTPCCQGTSMGTGTGGMTGTTNMQSGYSQPQQWQQSNMPQSNMRGTATGMTGAGTGGPCTYTFGSGAGGSTGRDFYGTGFHSWVERW